MSECKAETSQEPDIDNGGFGVYVHWPFCAAKCPYCDFNSHVRMAGIDQTVYARALCRELEALHGRSNTQQVSSIFFGGGTPSLMEPETVDVILRQIGSLWTVNEDAEITLEANPSSADAQNFGAYRKSGVNRLSIGVQSLLDKDLKFLGRLHSVAEARAAIDKAARHFDRISFDLIYARPRQSLAEWEIELGEAVQMPVEHLSLYQLTIEPGTPFAALFDKGKLNIPSDDKARALYDATNDICANAGFARYEVSNYARPGAQSRHNLIYWRYHDYAGAGPGAHSRLSGGGSEHAHKHAYVTEKHPETWASLVDRQGHGFTSDTQLSREQAGDEYLLMGLRLAEGIRPDRYYALSGRTLDKVKLDRLIESGLIERTGARGLAASNDGVAVLDRIIAELTG